MNPESGFQSQYIHIICNSNEIMSALLKLTEYYYVNIPKTFFVQEMSNAHEVILSCTSKMRIVS